ncbi:MAG TPA: hypothetical protein ENN08_06765, partial [Bacteroidales bacterium]|nr:hypothetical protein [Bacteroidales bacterium]
MTDYYPDIKSILTNSCIAGFGKNALEIFRYQYRNNPVYKKFCDLLGTKPESIQETEQIPFLPVE